MIIFYASGQLAIAIQEEILLSFVEKCDFENLTKIFINDYMEFFKDSNYEHTIFDHLIKPNNIEYLDKYFCEDTKIIVVKRDIRDLYLYGKYIRGEKGYPSKFPKNPLDFLKFWNYTVEKDYVISNPKVLTIFLEDLYYQEEETIYKIEKFLGLRETERTKKGLYYDRKVLEESVGLYKKSYYRDEVFNFKSEFPQWIYDDKTK